LRYHGAAFREENLLHRLAAGALLCLALSLPAFGQAHEFRRFDINLNMIGYARQGPQNLGAGNLALAVHLKERIAIVAEAGFYFAGDDTLRQDWTTYRFGPQVSRRYGKRVTTFAHALAGGARITEQSSVKLGQSTTTTSASVNGFSIGAGGGIDVGIREWFGFRVIQAEYNYVHLGSIDYTTNGVSLSAGVVFRFGK
jgi:hypothetical protein